MKTLEQLVAEYNQLEEEINNFEDGFLYKVTITSFGSNMDYWYKNSYLADKATWGYTGDHGFAAVETNNPDFKVFDDAISLTINLSLTNS